MLELSFKNYVEMSHLIPRKNGVLTPFLFDGAYVQAVDMKFEKYPDAELKKRLLPIDAKFFGKLPNTPKFLIFNGNNLEANSTPPIAPDYIRLPDDWHLYAMFEFTDGSIKHPEL